MSVLQIKTAAQLEAALSFFGATVSDDFKLNEFEEACGVGMTKKKLSLLFLCLGYSTPCSYCFLYIKFDACKSKPGLHLSVILNLILSYYHLP